MQDRFIDFCKDDAVSGRLCNIVLDYADVWFHAYQPVVSGIENSWLKRQLALVEGAQVLGMMNLVCAITDLAPEDFEELDPEKFRTLIFYIMLRTYRSHLM